MGSSQWGKTLILEVSLGWVIVEDPSWLLYVLPSDQGAGRRPAVQSRAGDTVHRDASDHR